MEKKFTINDVFYFINQAIEHDADLCASELGFCPSKIWINCNGFDITAYYGKNEKTITIQTYKLNSVRLNITDIEAAQFRVLWEKVKEYSKNKTIDKFLNCFREDNSKKTIDDIDD